MYLYFDRNGVLKEIVNDESLRQGNYGVNSMYVYVEGRDLSRADVNYLMPDGAVVGPILCDDFTDPTASDNSDCFIPFDPKRDLRFFKYYKAYKFLVVDLSTMDSNGKSALDQAGVVHCNMDLVLESGNQLEAGDVNFVVEENPSYNQKQVASEEYLSLADYLYLKKVINKIALGNVPDGSIDSAQLANGAVTNQKIATGTIESNKVKNNTLIREKLASINGTLLTDYVINEGPREEIQQFVDMMEQFIKYGYKLFYKSDDEIADVSLYVDVMSRIVQITIDANVYNLPTSTLLTGHVVTLTSDADVALFFSSLLSNYFAVSAIYSNHVFN